MSSIEVVIFETCCEALELFASLQRHSICTPQTATTTMMGENSSATSMRFQGREFVSRMIADDDAHLDAARALVDDNLFGKVRLPLESVCESVNHRGCGDKRKEMSYHESMLAMMLTPHVLLLMIICLHNILSRTS
jgi:hypothetical protein